MVLLNDKQFVKQRQPRKVKMSDQRPAETELMTLNETAKFLRLKISTLRAWRLNKRNLAFVRLGRKVFVRRADAEALIAANVEHPDPLRAV
jgi:hypothetical protein